MLIKGHLVRTCKHQTGKNDVKYDVEMIESPLCVVEEFLLVGVIVDSECHKGNNDRSMQMTRKTVAKTATPQIRKRKKKCDELTREK